MKLSELRDLQENAGKAMESAEERRRLKVTHKSEAGPQKGQNTPIFQQNMGKSNP